MVAPFAVIVSFGSHTQLAELGDSVWAVHLVIVVDEIVKEGQQRRRPKNESCGNPSRRAPRKTPIPEPA